MTDVRLPRLASVAGSRAGECEPQLPELLAASARGDEQAFARLYDLTCSRVYGMVLRVVRDRAQAAEVSQDVYLQVWRESARFDPNLAAQRVRRVLDELTVVQREAVSLAYFGGYTHHEVADLLHIPVGTVKTRIRDGLIRLRDALGVSDDRS